MEPGAIIVIITFGIILFVFSLVRRKANPQKYPEVVQSVLWDVKLNQAMISNYHTLQKPKLFEQNNWLLNKSRIGFLSETTKELLTETFELVAEYNTTIRASKKNKDASFRELKFTKLEDLLTRCRKELEDWMVKTTGSKEYTPKPPGISNLFFGGN